MQIVFEIEWNREMETNVFVLKFLSDAGSYYVVIVFQGNVKFHKR